VGLVGQAIEHGLAEPGDGEDLWPLGEGQVGGHDEGSPFGAFGDDLEEQLCGDLASGT
jgi:hypothetical protein